MKIIPISEGTFTIDSTKLFVPFDEKKDILQSRPTGSLLVEIQPFVVVTPHDILLLDTGLGFEKDGEMQLHSNLRQAGFEPSDITKVLLSHLHKDHAGGVGRELKSGKTLALPNARYYVQESELKFAFEKGFPSFITEELECLKNSDRVTLLNGNGFIDSYIQFEITAAHSPFHQVFWIRAENETIFFGADDAPQLQQMKHKFVAKYDYDGKKAMELRRNWKAQGQGEGWTFLFYHDVTNAAWKFPKEKS
jgi:glyoxylase-like metal-dependent hydrolase (beta-lactamase superfamily II)